MRHKVSNYAHLIPYVCHRSVAAKAGSVHSIFSTDLKLGRNSTFKVPNSQSSANCPLKVHKQTHKPHSIHKAVSQGCHLTSCVVWATPPHSHTPFLLPYHRTFPVLCVAFPVVDIATKRGYLRLKALLVQTATLLRITQAAELLMVAALLFM